MNILLAVILGSLFGGALYYSGASDPKKLLSMVNLWDLSLMKIIFFAIGFAALLLGISITAGFFDLSHLSIKSMNFGVILGGMIFGIGFGWAGTCPGTCVAASGTKGIKKSLFAVFGGLIGAFVFSLSYGFWKELGLFDLFNLGKITLFSLSEQYASVFSVGSLGLAAMGALFMITAILIPERK